MINNDNDQVKTEKVKTAETPDENSGIVVQGYLKIFDPESGEVLAQGRA